MAGLKSTVISESITNGSTNKAKLEEVQLVVFRVGESYFGLDILNVIKIIKKEKITSLPDNGGRLLGVFNYRGKVLPVAYFKSLLNLGTEEETANMDFKLVVQVADKSLAIPVDQVIGTNVYSRKDIQPVPETIGDNARDYGGIIKDGERLVLIVNESAISSRTSKSKVDENITEETPDKQIKQSTVGETAKETAGLQV